MYCSYCGELLLAGDVVIPAEHMFHGELHAECLPFWEEQYYGLDKQLPWERWWDRFLDSLTFTESGVIMNSLETPPGRLF